MPHASVELARYLTDFRSQNLSPAAIRSVQRCLLDLVGAALAGVHARPAEAFRKLVTAFFSSGQASVWFSAENGPAAAAALANSAAASALDIDDGHRSAQGHPGASIIPAAIAAAQEVDAPGMELITAIALGYDVAVRIAAARDSAAQDTLSTGRWCAYGAVAAAARLYGTPVDDVAQALAIAGVQSPGLSASGYSTVMGNHVKEGIPWATFTGLCALQLAGCGFSGPIDILDHPAYYARERIVEGLGTGSAVETVYFKPYACCRWIHSALDALGEILEATPIDPDDLREIRVHSFERALRLNNHPDPASLEGAQYSINFCLAVLAIEGPKALLPLEPTLLGRPDLVALARKVSLHLDPEIDSRFPGQAGARVVVISSAGDHEKRCLHPLGDPANPMDFNRLTSKFHSLTHPYSSQAWREALIDAVAVLPVAGPGPLFALLKQPPSTTIHGEIRA